MTITLPPRAAPDAVDILEKSNETIEWLRRNIRVGFTSELGPAWWADGVRNKSGEWVGIPEGSHFPGPVPIEEVVKLLDVPFTKGTVHTTWTDLDGNRQVSADEGTEPIVNQLTGKVFSYPSSGYKIHPYLETLHGFITAIQYDEQAVVYSCGLLKQGGQAFLTAVLPESLRVCGYEYMPFISGLTSVDLSRSTTYPAGYIGIVCDNTGTQAINEALAVLRVTHRSELPPVEVARGKLGLRLADVGGAVGEAIEGLCKVDVSDADFARWLDEIQPQVTPDPLVESGGRTFINAERKRAEMTRLWTEDAKVAPWKGTGFGILQLDNTYRQWAGSAPSAGGQRLEQNYSRFVRGATKDADKAALAALAKVQGRKVVVPV